MGNRNKLLIVAFYLAKFNKVAYENLGYTTITKAHEDLGEKLGYKGNSVKNRRDDFDPLFEHRVGHKMELSKSHLEIVDGFDHLSEEALRAIVLDLLEEELSEEIFLPINTNRKSSIYTTRGITGKKAEAYFIEWFAEHFPEDDLVDTRDLGCGYDFSIKNAKQVYEVKGLSGVDGGVLFTDKEWKVAAELQDDYYLVLIKDCFSEEPEVEMYSNPHLKFSPKKQISTVINVSWGISACDLK